MTREERQQLWVVCAVCSLVAVVCGVSIGVLAALPLPPGDRLPSAVCDTLKAERAQYGTPISKGDLGAVLNATAYAHRGLSMGLGGKTSGTRCSSLAGWIACDLLYRKSDGVGWDVIVDVEGSARVNCTASGVLIDNRPWIAPAHPGTGPTPPDPPDCPDCPSCPTCPPSTGHPVSAKQFADLQAYTKTLETHIHTLTARVAALEGATYVVKGSTSRDWGHGHTVDLPVQRKP